jgi:hypothetical protein
LGLNDMGKKKRIKLLRKIAGELPVVLVHTKEVHFVTGAELLEQGETEVDGQKIIPEKRYVQDMPVQLAINHARQLKKIYQKHGYGAVGQYIDQVQKTVSDAT